MSKAHIYYDGNAWAVQCPDGKLGDLDWRKHPKPDYTHQFSRHSIPTFADAVAYWEDAADCWADLTSADMGLMTNCY